MENKTTYQAELFSNRLKKKYKELRKWARKNRIMCYRLYNRDIPEIPVSLDLYEFLPEAVDTPIEAARFLQTQNTRLSENDPTVEKEIKERTYAVLYLYERPYEKSDEEEELWLEEMSKAAAGVLQIEKNHIIKKYRRHQTHKEGNQYQKNETGEEIYDDEKITGLTAECGSLFRLDLSSYLDTGLFFDHRPLREVVRDTCSNKDVLNLFCYTGSFSVYAAGGNAKSVESVDLSNTYLDWAKDNMKLNGFDDKKRYTFTREDCVKFLKEKALAQKSLCGTEKDNNKNTGEVKPKTYDLIILDPPTFSNSKKTFDVFDVNRDWSQLVKDCLNILNPGGVLYFSTNSEKLKFDSSLIPPKTLFGKNYTAEEITPETIPEDYEGKKPHRVWKFSVENKLF